MFKEQYEKLVGKYGKRNVMLGAGVIAVIVVGWIVNAASQRADDVAAERMIGALSGGKVDVDSGDGTVTVKTDQGTWSTSKELPADWPSDVPLYPGAELQGSVASADGQDGVGHYVGLLTGDSAATVSAWYKSELTAKGWTVSLDVNSSEGGMLGAEKDGRAVAVIIALQDGKTAVSLSVGTK